MPLKKDMAIEVELLHSPMKIKQEAVEIQAKSFEVLLQVPSRHEQSPTNWAHRSPRMGTTTPIVDHSSSTNEAWKTEMTSHQKLSCQLMSLPQGSPHLRVVILHNSIEIS